MTFMSQLSITYKRNTATVEQVLAHLEKCNDNFVPSLDKKVELKPYAEKITKYAIKFEAWIADELAGLVAAYFNDENKSTFITNVSTTKQYSGNGIASQLMKECISFAKHKDFKEINLQVSQSNISAIGLYSKFGFKKINVENGEITMQKELLV